MFLHRGGHQDQIDIIGVDHLFKVGGKALVLVIRPQQPFAFFLAHIAGDHRLDAMPDLQLID